MRKISQRQIMSSVNSHSYYDKSRLTLKEEQNKEQYGLMELSIPTRLKKSIDRYGIAILKDEAPLSKGFSDTYIMNKSDKAYKTKELKDTKDFVIIETPKERYLISPNISQELLSTVDDIFDTNLGSMYRRMTNSARYKESMAKREIALMAFLKRIVALFQPKNYQLRYIG